MTQRSVARARRASSGQATRSTGQTGHSPKPPPQHDRADGNGEPVLVLVVKVQRLVPDAGFLFPTLADSQPGQRTHRQRGVLAKSMKKGQARVE